jgi:hypothetical protein
MRSAYDEAGLPQEKKPEKGRSEKKIKKKR